ncbi:uncharacterized protein LOC103520559 isoform X1 [Diaphorina citri]|uniref:Uncharacterized protein LOC103520559 isoform X1 n=1 Tax=Diaphorina citri TaxID=121845 RepID=A0A1S3DLC0_DIACI|nr:uncharacterized protein LOC103520559 isoform X1 [Diaphorina citri]
MVFDNQQNYSRFNSHPLGKVKYKKDYKKSKVPLFRYMDKKTTTNEMLSQRQPSGYTSGLANGDRDGNGSNGNKSGKDSMKMINDIVKDIVKKYKTRFNPAKSGRDEVDSNLCICQFQDTHSIPDRNLYNLNLDQIGTTLSSIYESKGVDFSTLALSDKDKLKQLIIDKVIALLNASKAKSVKEKLV